MYIDNYMHYQSPLFSGGDVPTEAIRAGDSCDELDKKLVTVERKLRRDGWQTVAAIDTQTEFIIRDDASEAWFVHEVSSTQTAALAKVFNDGGLIPTYAHQQQCDGQLYELLLLLNPSSEHAILLPTIVETEQLLAATPVGDEVELYSVVTHSNGERIGAVQHSTTSSILPDAT